MKALKLLGLATAIVACTGVAIVVVVVVVILVYVHVGNNGEADADKKDQHTAMMLSIPRGSSLLHVVNVLRSKLFNDYARTHTFSSWTVDQDVQRYGSEKDIGIGESGRWPGGSIVFARCQSPDDSKEMFVRLHFDRTGGYTYYTAEEYGGRMM